MNSRLTISLSERLNHRIFVIFRECGETIAIVQHIRMFFFGSLDLTALYQLV